jgi:hypothetical protein
VISLDSFSTYNNFAQTVVKPGEVVACSSADAFEKDLNMIKDFTQQVIPSLLADIFYLLDSNAEIKISNDRKSLGRVFELTDDQYPDGKKLEYEDCSIILETDEAFPENQTKFKLNDFKYYTVKLDTDGNFFQRPRTIYIRGRLTDQGKFDEDRIEQFSYTNFTDCGMEDGIVFYTNSKDTLEQAYGKQVPKDQKLEDGAFIFDIDRPFAKDPEDIHAKQILLLRSGFALRTV